MVRRNLRGKIAVSGDVNRLIVLAFADLGDLVTIGGTDMFVLGCLGGLIVVLMMVGYESAWLDQV